MDRLLARSSVALAIGAFVASGFGDPARADNGQAKGPSRESTQEVKGQTPTAPPPVMGGRPVTPPKPALPVTLTIVAKSPDPPWIMRIENTGEHPIRIAADVRLLSFDLERAGGGKQKCAAPASLRPSKFPNDRELYLKPGESFVEEFDPRLYCFGGTLDSLTGGTIVHPHYGWAPNAWSTKGPYAAQGIDRPEEFAAPTQIDGASLLLSFRKFEPMKNPADPAQATAEPKPADDTHCAKKPAPAPPPGTKSAMAWPEKPDQGCTTAIEGPAFVDQNAAQVDVQVDRFNEAQVARDIVINIRAKNVGKRDLVTALRGGMFSFTVEELGSDNKARRVVDCTGGEKPHAIAAEMFHDIDAGRALNVPLLLAEVCPRGTFERPGLYRVRPRIDTTVQGEGLALQAFIGKALARQTTLVRLATGREAFEDQGPKVFVPPAPPAAEPSSQPPAP